MSPVSSVSELHNLIASAYVRRLSFFGRKEHKIAIIMQVNKEVSVEKNQLTFAPKCIQSRGSVRARAWGLHLSFLTPNAQLRFVLYRHGSSIPR
jgi:hypothetical protein